MKVGWFIKSIHIFDVDLLFVLIPYNTPYTYTITSSKIVKRTKIAGNCVVNLTTQ